MTPVRSILFGLALATLPFTAQAAPAVGQPAPAFTGTDSNGNAVSFGDFAGKTVVLEWTNNECPYVRKHYESNNMQTLQGEATADGIVWLSIISSPPGEQGNVDAATANQLTVSRGAHPSHVLLDPTGTIAQAYEAKTTPHMFVISDAGVLAYMGGIDDKPTTDQADIATARNHVRMALAEMKAGSPVSVPESTPYGCSVKYAPDSAASN